MKNNSGFTLTEILTAVVIVTILVTMALPLYEKTIERSRLAEARTLLAKLQDAKLYTMDNMECAFYDPAVANCPKIRHLNIGYVANEGSEEVSFDTRAFRFSLNPISDDSGGLSDQWWKNAVCAKRLGGDYAGTVFLYASPDIVPNSLCAANSSCAQFLCYGSQCEDYGYSNAAENSDTVTQGINITCD